MLQSKSVAILGAGNIGRALIGGLLHGTPIAASSICATRRGVEALHLLEHEFPGIGVTTDNVDAVRDASVVVLAIKPSNLEAVAAEIQGRMNAGTLVISVLAGITTEALARRLGEDLAIVRAMPNTPALVDLGATAIAGSAQASEEDVEVARQIFAAVGTVEVVPEYLMDAVTGLSGSGPAYVYMVIEALTDGGVKQGLPRPTALRLAAQTVLGAAKLVLETGKHPAILRDEVTTPGGTAIAAVADLESHGLRTMLINAVATAAERSRQLAEKAQKAEAEAPR